LIIYQYECPACKRLSDVLQSVEDDHEHAYCTCGAVADRVWRYQVDVPHFEPHYNHGLGEFVASKSELRDAKTRYHDRTGSRLVELGTDTAWRADPPRRAHYPTAGELGI